jgi:tape measure domain-containing protein
MNDNKIDQRIVEMSFENHKFEKGISQSQNSLKKFSDALKNSDIKEGFSGLDRSVNALSNSFSMLEQIGVGALRRIGEAAINAGTKLVKSLTIDPAIAGWTKYEQKTAAVQTIMNATGKSIDQVNGYLDKLMWFSDETSYGFTDMTAALAQMTSSGGDIDDLIPLITGVANATAFAGKGAAEFSRAMYNLNQSYGAGNLQFMDWRSLELAGVAGKDLKRIFIETGIALGTLDKNGKTAKGTLVDIGTFGSTLQEKWANTKVMEAAFGKFSELSEAAYELVNNGTYDTAAEAMESLAGKYSVVAEKGFQAAQTAKTFNEAISATMDAVSSGWMRTYELMFGDLEEAKANFTALTEILWTVFASGAESRNEMLSWLKEFGGVSNVFQGFKNVAIAVLSVLRPISQAFDEIFPPRTKEQWLEITKVFKDFTASLRIADSTGDKIRRTFAGLFAVIDMGWQLVKFLGRSVFELVSAFFPLGDGILGASASLGDLLVNINKAIKSSEIFQYGILAIKVGAAILREQLAKTIAVVKDFVIGLWNAEDPFEYLRNIGSNIFAGFIDSVKMAASWLSGKFTKVVKDIFKLFDKDFDESVVGIWPKILEVLKEVVKFIGGEAVYGFKNFGDAIKSLDFSRIATFVVGGVILMFIKQLTDLTAAMTGFVNSFSGVVKAFTKKFLSMPQTGIIKDIALAIGTLAASIWLLSTIPADDLERAFYGLAAAIGVFVVAYALIQGINVAAHKMTKDKDMATSAFGLTGVAAALLIMAAAVKVISKVEKTEVWNSVLVLGAMLGFITAYQALTALISKIPGQQKVSMNLLGMSLSISMLIGSLVLLNFLTRSEIESSLGKLAAIMLVVGALEGVFAFTARIGRGKQISVGILQLAVGITALIGAMKLLTFIDHGTIKEGLSKLALMALTIAGIELVMGLVGRVSGGKKVQTNILAMSVGILAMIGLVAIVGKMTTEVLDQGIKNLAKIAGIVVGIQLFTALSARIAGTNKVQKILGSVSFALLSFTGVIALLGNLPPKVLDQGLDTLKNMVGLISTIGIITAVTSRVSGNSRMFATLVGVSMAILALTGALSLLAIPDQGILREAAKSLLIAAAAIGVLSFSIEKIAGAVTSISKDSKGFKANAKKVGYALLGLGVVLGATVVFFYTLKAVLPIIKGVTPKEFIIFTVGLAAVSALVISIGNLGKEFEKGQIGKQFRGLLSGLIALGVVLVATAGFFGTLSGVLMLPGIKNLTVDQVALFTFGVGVVSALIISYGHIGEQFTKGQFGKSFRGLASGFLALSAILLGTAAFFGVLAGVLMIPGVKNLTVDQIALFTFGLGVVSALIISFGRIEGQLTKGKFEKSMRGLVSGFLSLGAILLATAGFFGTLSLVLSLPGIKDIQMEDFAMFLLAVAGVSAIIGGIAVLGKAFEVVGQGGLAVIKGVGVAIVAMIAVVAATALLAEALNLLIVDEAGLIRGIDLLVEIGAGIGRFVGSIVGGVGGGVLEAIGISVANFAETMNGVTFSPGALEAITSLASAVVLITGASLIQGLNSFFNLGTGAIDTFGTQIAGLVSAVKQISVKDAGEATNILAAMKPMAESLTLFADIAKDIPNSGGWLGGIVGDNDIDTFGTKLALFVSVFSYITASEAVHMTEVLAAMKPMAENLKLFATTAQGIPNSGGFVEEFMGENDIDKFGKKLVKFVGVFNLITVAQAVYMTEVLAAMKPMAENLKLFADVSKDIPNSGGWVGGIVGDNDIDEFGIKLAELNNIFGTVDTAILNAAITNLKTMNDQMLPNLEKFAAFAISLNSFDGYFLRDFAKDFRTFTEVLAKVDFSVVEPAMAAMDDVTASFQTLGATVLENAKKSFENNKEPFQKVITSILVESIKKLESQKKELVDKFTGVFKSVTDRVNSYAGAFKTLGVNIIDGLIQGIESRRPTAVAITKNVLSAIIFGAQRTVDARSPSKVFEKIGGWCTLGLAQGIKKETKVAVAAGKNMASATEEAVRNTLGVHSLSTLFKDIGGWIGKSLGVGTKSSTSDAVTAAKDLSTNVVTAAKSTVQNGMDQILQKARELGIDTGNITSTSVQTALAGSAGGVSNTIDELLKILTDPAAAISAAQGGSSIGNAFGGGLNGGSSGGVAGAAAKAKTAIEKLKEELDELNFYGTINLEEELLRYQTLRAKYKEGSAEDKQLDREVYTRLKTIYNAQMSYIDGVKKAKEDAAKEVADLETKYNDDVASELESAEIERERSRKEFADKQTAINEKLLSDIEAQNNAYENAVKSRASTIASSYSLFEGVDLSERASGFELLKNLHDQNDALTVWKHSLSELEKRGISGALLEELQAMGPSANAQLRALLSLTDEQLTEYVGLYERKYSFATDKAEDELVGLKNTTRDAIGTLRTEAAAELKALSDQFDETMIQINTDSDLRLGELETSYNESLGKINTDLQTNLTTMKTQFDTTMKTIKTETEAELVKLIAANKEQLTQLNKDSDTKLGTVKETFGAGATAIVSSFGEPIKEIVPNTMAALTGLKPSLKTTFEGITSDFVTAGLNAAEGFAKGIRDGVDMVIDAATHIASAAVATARRILNENSPSKVFEGIGQFVSMGFARGITDYAYQAEKASEEMARGPIAAVSEALASMEDSNEYSFTITPVIDLSAIKSTDLSRMLSTPVALGAASGQLAAETVQNGTRVTQPVTTTDGTTNSTTNNATITMTNNFSVRHDNDIRKISNELGNLINRYSNARGVTVP